VCVDVPGLAGRAHEADSFVIHVEKDPPVRRQCRLVLHLASHADRTGGAKGGVRGTHRHGHHDQARRVASKRLDRPRTAAAARRRIVPQRVLFFMPVDRPVPFAAPVRGASRDDQAGPARRYRSTPDGDAGRGRCSLGARVCVHGAGQSSPSATLGHRAGLPYRSIESQAQGDFPERR